MIRRRARADQADPRSSNSMYHNQQSLLARHSDDYEAFFVDGMVGFWDRDRERITEDGDRLRKCDTVLSPIR